MLLPTLIGLRIAFMGTLTDLSLFRRPNALFFIVPDDHTNTTVPDASSLLQHGLDCTGSNLLSLVPEAVFLPKGTDLRPACKGRTQVLKRMASVKSASLQLALDSLDSRSMPCSVLVLSGNASVRGFEFACDANMTGYLGSSIAIWPESNEDSLLVQDVKGTIYVGCEDICDAKNISLLGLRRKSIVFKELVNELQVSGEDIEETDLCPQCGGSTMTNIGPVTLGKIVNPQCNEETKGDLAFRVSFGVSLIVIISLIAFIVHAESDSKTD